MRAPHHTQVKKAEKLGFILEADHESNRYVVRWPERNRVGYTKDDVSGLIKDMETLRMAALNYPQFNIQQSDNFEWQIRRGRKIVRVCPVGQLRDALYDLLDEEAPEVKPSPAKKVRESVKRVVKKTQAEDVDVEFDKCLTDPEDLDFEDEDLDDSDEPQEDEEKPTRSVVKPKYRSLYKKMPVKNTCSDDLVVQLREYLETEILDDQGEFVRHGIDTEKLRRFAIYNGLWDEKYSRLNPGMQRMNVGNRLRAKQRKNPDWSPVWVE